MIRSVVYRNYTISSESKRPLAFAHSLKTMWSTNVL